MMHWIIWLAIGTFINTFIIITIVDVVLMDPLMPRISRRNHCCSFMVRKENRIDIQKGNSCSGYAIAYVLRHHDIAADGDDIYTKLPDKMANGYVYPKKVKKMFEEYGFHVAYCAGNLNALKNEVSKGNPVIVFIKVRRDRKWLHYVPVVGYDEENIFLAESLEELVNCSEETYNRKISNGDFKALWNTSMLKMPLYTHTFYTVSFPAYTHT